MGKSG